MIGILVAIAVYAVMVLVLRAIGLDNVHQTIRQLGIWSPIVFVAVCAVSLILAPLSSSSILVTSGVLFGPQIGFTLAFLGTLLGCSANFWISRKFGRKFAIRLVGKSNLNDMDRFINRLKGHHGILFMMLILPISQDLISYAVGLTKIKFSHFFIALVVSALAVAALYVYFGSNLIGKFL